MREALVASLDGEPSALENLAAILAERLPHSEVRLVPGATPAVVIGAEGGVLVRCLVSGGEVNLTLEAPENVPGLPLDLPEPFIAGPRADLPGGSNCLVSRRMSGDLPTEHRLLNDVQALVMLAGLMEDPAPGL